MIVKTFKEYTVNENTDYSINKNQTNKIVKGFLSVMYQTNEDQLSSGENNSGNFSERANKRATDIIELFIKSCKDSKINLLEFSPSDDDSFYDVGFSVFLAYAGYSSFSEDMTKEELSKLGKYCKKLDDICRNILRKEYYFNQIFVDENGDLSFE